MAKKEKTLKEKRTEVLGRFIVAQAEYLRESGWVPLIPKVPGGPVWWKDPVTLVSRGQENACSVQESRDNDIVYRD